MNSSRKDRPKRSGHASDSPGRTYRFKSYLDANTQELARFDAMQEHVPDKIDEVMASFREEKLTVHPQRSKQVADEIATANTPFFSTAKAEPVKKKSRSVWPWYVGLASLALVLVLVLNAGDKNETGLAPMAPASPAPELKVAERVIPPSSADKTKTTAAVEEPKPQVAVEPASTVVAKAIKKEVKVEPASPEVVVAPVKKKPKKVAPVHTYSEDLTDILQKR